MMNKTGGPPTARESGQVWVSGRGRCSPGRRFAPPNPAAASSAQCLWRRRRRGCLPQVRLRRGWGLGRLAQLPPRFPTGRALPRGCALLRRAHAHPGLFPRVPGLPTLAERGWGDRPWRKGSGPRLCGRILRLRGPAAARAEAQGPVSVAQHRVAAARERREGAGTKVGKERGRSRCAWRAAVKGVPGRAPSRASPWSRVTPRSLQRPGWQVWAWEEGSNSA